MNFIKQNFEAVIFDMDGVLADTNPYHKKAWLKFADNFIILKYNIQKIRIEENIFEYKDDIFLKIKDLIIILIRFIKMSSFRTCNLF